MPTIDLNVECPHCGGTGLYMGMAERNGAAVVCHQCKGTGCYHFVYEYKEFIRRKVHKEAQRVFQHNPGIAIGEKADGSLKLEDFGGMHYQAWWDGKPFPAGSEMRSFTCPAWWYQSVNYKLKPDWNECAGPGSSFSACEHFGSKGHCWARWDREFGREGKGDE